MYVCEECGQEFERFQEKANHIRWKHKDNSEYLEKASDSAKKGNERRFGKWISDEIKCSKTDCSNQIKIKYREGKKKERYFCSRSCANYRGSTKKNFTKEVKNKIRQKVIKAWDNQKYNECKIFSSRKEREIVSYFKDKYPDDGWKSGGSAKMNGVRIVRDLWSDILKICFEYDGIWHFENIKGQLEEKRNKDKILEDWCKLNGYRLIRIDELAFQSLSQIEKLIYENKDLLLKIGERY